MENKRARRPFHYFSSTLEEFLLMGRAKIVAGWDALSWYKRRSISG